MQMLWAILAVVGGGLLLWQCYRYVKGNPNAFSRENMSKTSNTLLYLLLFLIVVVGFCVLTLKF
jgi:hypothetical protein